MYEIMAMRYHVLLYYNHAPVYPLPFPKHGYIMSMPHAHSTSTITELPL